MQVHTAATTGFFHTNTSDFPTHVLQVNCTDPIPSLPKFSSPTFQLASQHCSKWRNEQRWCKWTWWKASSRETENMKIAMVNTIQTHLSIWKHKHAQQKTSLSISTHAEQNRRKQNQRKLMGLVFLSWCVSLGFEVTYWWFFGLLLFDLQEIQHCTKFKAVRSSDQQTRIIWPQDSLGPCRVTFSG